MRLGQNRPLGRKVVIEGLELKLAVSSWLGWSWVLVGLMDHGFERPGNRPALPGVLVLQTDEGESTEPLDIDEAGNVMPGGPQVEEVAEEDDREMVDGLAVM